MEESRKKIFTPFEKLCIKELVTKNKGVVEIKKSDGVSVLLKKRKWQDIANDFNQNPQFSKRTAEQIKKCWFNMEAKRKMDQRNEWKSVDGKPVSESTSKVESNINPICDNVDIEVQDIIDSDTLALIPSEINGESSTILDDSTLGTTSKEKSNETAEERLENFLKTNYKGNKRGPRDTRDIRRFAIMKETNKRVERYDSLKEQDKELHLMRKKEMEFKIMTAEAELNKGIFELKQMKEKHEVELQILKQKL